MDMETEVRTMGPPAKEYHGRQALRRVRKGSPREPSEGAWPFRHLAFGLLAPRTVRELISVV